MQGRVGGAVPVLEALGVRGLFRVAFRVLGAFHCLGLTPQKSASVRFVGVTCHSADCKLDITLRARPPPSPDLSFPGSFSLARLSHRWVGRWSGGGGGK